MKLWALFEQKTFSDSMQTKAESEPKKKMKTRRFKRSGRQYPLFNKKGNVDCEKRDMVSRVMKRNILYFMDI